MFSPPPGMRPMDEAPTRRSVWVALWYYDGCNIYPVAAHFAQDLSGEEQPPFRGWFQWTGCQRAGHHEAPANPIGWTEIGDDQPDMFPPRHRYANPA